jgi:hypothetical protein
MKKPKNAAAEAGPVNRPLSMKERARKARHEAYVHAKERRKNDPRTLQLKEKAKQLRREASAKAKERRKNDPEQIAFKEKLKKERQEATKLAKAQRKAAAAEVKKAERASKDARLNVTFVGLAKRTRAGRSAVRRTAPSFAGERKASGSLSATAGDKKADPTHVTSAAAAMRE